MKSYSEACDQNRWPIFNTISPILKHCKTLLEVGSGTGQHAVYFAADLPHLHWQTSDRMNYHPSIQAWLEEAKLENVSLPLELDTRLNHWPDKKYDAVFSANTTHIMHWPDVIGFFEGVGTVLNTKGCFLLYGPFNYENRYTSLSNENFDDWLKQRDPDSGIRNVEDLNALAIANGLQLVDDFAMPANNRLLFWQKN